ncbi:MAG: hypothetical protein K9N47_12050 [Prosthecobacter sp.]|uniref:c-type cytochrome domain-containing protein n=1 Tax=Prosthecobacter sp. TaxID=1965333 RepID=UPI0025EA6F5F|nr:c-type cytochrome domain-containing protein [Prosthecobacter sp.]MCF7786849.1 hypothetical protein [Prosthecobacter sp.]
MKLIAFAAMAMAYGLTSCMQMEPPQEVDFVGEVKPLLETRCLECHQHQYVCAGLNLETRSLAMKGGRSGAVILPGSPHQSLLYKVLLLGHESPVAMPPTPEGMEQEGTQILHDWIQQGAKWPDNVRLVPPQEWKNKHS